MGGSLKLDATAAHESRYTSRAATLSASVADYDIADVRPFFEKGTA